MCKTLFYANHYCFKIPFHKFRESINRIRVHLVVSANVDSNKPISSLQPRWRPTLTTCASILSIPPPTDLSSSSSILDVELTAKEVVVLQWIPSCLDRHDCCWCWCHGLSVPPVANIAFENDNCSVNSNVTNPILSTAQIQHSTRMI